MVMVFQTFQNRKWLKIILSMLKLKILENVINRNLPKGKGYLGLIQKNHVEN